MSTTDYTGKTLDGKYHVIELLGEGGMGAVYLGQHIAIGKPVAIKFLHAELAVREEVVKRFYREAQAAATIRHRNIIDVMDLGVSEEGDPYLVMEYLEGEALGSRLENHGPMELPAACGILEAALVALDAAHENGIVHRDLKPDNIFLVHHKGETPGVKLIDFGISKFVTSSDQTKLTQDGSMLGTPAYMSPEQARGQKELDHRTDIYAVGVIMFEMLTGGQPYTGENYNELLINMLTSEPQDPATVYADFPEKARPIIEKALDKDPDRRFQTAMEMRDALRNLSPVDEQIKNLTVLGGELDNSSFATGDLGKSQIELGDTRAASDLFQEMMEERSPLSGKKTKGTTETKLAKRAGKMLVALSDRLPFVHRFLARPPVKKLLSKVGLDSQKAAPPLVGGTIAALLTGLITLGLVNMCSDGSEDSAVLIRVKGVPKGAKIYYDDSLVPENPFRVDRGETIVPLRIEIPGKEAVKVSVVPSEDRTVRVGQGSAPRPKSTKKTKTEKQSGKKQAAKKPATKKDDKSPSSKKTEKSKGAKKSEKSGTSKKSGKQSSEKSGRPKRRWQKILNDMPWNR